MRSLLRLWSRLAEKCARELRHSTGIEPAAESIEMSTGAETFDTNLIMAGSKLDSMHKDSRFELQNQAD